MTPLYIFWIVWKETNTLTFDNAKFLVQRMKNSFVCILLSWYRMFVDVGPMPFFFGFINWLDSK